MRLFWLFSLFLMTGLLQQTAVYADDAATDAVIERKDVTFYLDADDIVSWEESGEGKYIYFTVSSEKGDELEKIADGHVGDILAIKLDGLLVSRAVISSPIRSDVGFALSPEEDKRAEILAMLDPAKKTELPKQDMGFGAGARIVHPEE